jgi:hypothetical protein
VIDTPEDDKKRRGPRRDDGKPAGRPRPACETIAPGAAQLSAQKPMLHQLRKQENNHAATSTQKIS